MSWMMFGGGQAVFTKAMDEQLALSRRSRRRTQRRTNRRLAELEDDLARVALLARALADLCVAKGVLELDELAACIRKVDLLDGEADGKLDPDALGS